MINNIHIFVWLAPQWLYIIAFEIYTKLLMLHINNGSKNIVIIIQVAMIFQSYVNKMVLATQDYQSKYI